MNDGPDEPSPEERPLIIEQVRLSVAKKGQDLGLEFLPKTVDDEVVERFLSKNSWNACAAEDAMVKMLQWRSEEEPNVVHCPLCRHDPLSHALRPVGVDALGNLVLYACFAANPGRFDISANYLHLLRLMEDADKTVKRIDKSRKWTFFIDFEGYCMADNNPQMALGLTRIIPQYPKRGAMFIMYDSGILFESFWGIIQTMFEDSVLQQVRFVNRGELPTTMECLGPEMLDWLRIECAINRTRAVESRRYWEPCTYHDPETGEEITHDGRGVRSWVEGPFFADIRSYFDKEPEPYSVYKEIDLQLEKLFNNKLGIRLHTPSPVYVTGFDVSEAATIWHRGDVVLAVNGSPVGDVQEFSQIFATARESLPVTIRVRRGFYEEPAADN